MHGDWPWDQDCKTAMNSITRPEVLRPEAPENASVPTRLSSALFAAKAQVLRGRRQLIDILHPVPKLRQAQGGGHPLLLAESVTPLWSDPRHSEARFQFGKVENLRRAAQRFDGLCL